MGFWEGANKNNLRLSETVNYAVSTSAGCAVATACMLDRTEEALAYFKDMVASNPGNVHWQNLRLGADKPVFPHIDMYRSLLEGFLSNQDLVQLADKQLEFLLAVFPNYLPSVPGVLLAFVAYSLENRLTGAMHPTWTGKLGFRSLVKGNRDVENISELIDIMLAASNIPPVLTTSRYKGSRVLDGGIIDSVPVHLTNKRKGMTLVLLSKQYRHPLPNDAWRIYVQPSESISINKLDYANPKGLQAAYDLGWNDGARFALHVLRNSPGVLPVHRLNARLKVLGSEKPSR